MIDLQAFCAPPETAFSGIYGLEHVHCIAGRLWATDARILVSVPAPDGAAPTTGAPDFLKTMKGFDRAACATPMPEPDADARGEDQKVPCESCVDCPECNGTGEVECEYECTHPCPECNGSGTKGMPDKTQCPECHGEGFTVVHRWKVQKVGNRLFNSFYLDLIHRRLSGVKADISGDASRPMFFIADDGVEGVLMPMLHKNVEAGEYYSAPR